MKKYEYLSELEKRLSALPADARRDALNYYEEYFDAAGPDNEDATAAELGDPAEAARKILEGEGLTPDADPAAPESARGGAVPPTAPEPPFPEPPLSPGDAVVAGALRHTEAAYVDLIASCQQQIRAGESYEICLTNTVTWPHTVDDTLLAWALRQVSPVPFGVWLRGGGVSVVGASPERLVRVGHDGTVEARPIKGTRPRDADPTRDAALARDLAESNGGRLELAPAEPARTTRRYLPGTNVLETTHVTASGTVRIVDALNTGGAGRLPWTELARRVEGDAPESLVRREVDRRLEEFVHQLAHQGMDPREMSLDWDKLREGQREAAVETVKCALVLDELSQRGLLYVDPRPGKTVDKLADVPGRAVDAVIDDPLPRAEIEAKLVSLERIVRDLRVHRILEGTNEIMRVITAREMMRQ